jgi:UDP-N-acetyl-2-amino-2-deoxyglucuronate dehydrogenase
VTYRIAILGAGNISETHARAASEIPGVEIVSVWGDNAIRAAHIAERFGATAYRELEQCLAHRPLDVVLVGSPSGLHAEHAMAAARQGLHALVEKPLDITKARIDDLIRECERAGVKLGVFFQDRVAPDIRWLRQLILSGGLGRVSLASARVKWYRPAEYYSGSRWRGTWALDGGGALMNQGIHTVDLLLWLLGEPIRVYAHTRTALHAIEVEDTAIAFLEFADGAIATLEATTAAYPGFPRRLEVTGSEGTVILEGDQISGVTLREPPSDPPPSFKHKDVGRSEQAVSAKISDIRGHRAMLEDFLHAIETGGRPLCDGLEARSSVALVQAIYHSAETGEPVTLQPAPV